MTAPQPRLSMSAWLEAVVEHRFDAREYLIAQGINHKVIYRKAELSARKGLTEYGVVADRPWLTNKGRAWLAANPVQPSPQAERTS